VLIYKALSLPLVKSILWTLIVLKFVIIVGFHDIKHLVILLNVAKPDWFYGFKLHIIINDEGELINCFISSGNLDDRKGLLKMANSLNGNVFADKGYLSKQLSQTLQQQNVKLITRVRKNMTPPEYTPFEKLILQKRALIETVIGQLKMIYELEHTRHRCLTSLMIHLLGVLISYSLQVFKPSLRLRKYSTSSLSSNLLSS
jgi:hypothetical protein